MHCYCCQLTKGLIENQGFRENAWATTILSCTYQPNCVTLAEQSIGECTMDEQQAVTTPAAEQVTPSSFLSRATDVFAAPGDLYSEVAATPTQTSSWLLPLIFSILMGVVFTFALHSNATLRQQLADMQHEAMQKSVAEGRMTQEQADRAEQMMDSRGSMFLVIGTIGAVVTITVMFFGGALVFWLIAKLALKFAGNYLKMLEVYGLASLIGVLGAIITLLMMNLFNSFYATPSGSLLVLNSFDSTNYVHKLLAAIGVFSIWQMIVLGVGLGKVSNKSTGTGIGIAIGLWIVWILVASLLGWGIR
jgi:hypothetical protein